MKLDKTFKSELMEMIDGAFSADPLATRKEVRGRVIGEMDHRPDTLEQAQDVSLEYMVEAVIGEYVRRTRSRIKGTILSGQTDSGAAPPPYEAVSKIRLTIPFGNGEFEDKPALLCTIAEVAAARSYYARQKRAIDKREQYCADLEAAMKDAELLPHQTVAELYAA